jgi:hypothetical protein
MRSILFGAALSTCFGTAVAYADDLSGTWTGNTTCNGQYLEPQPWPLTINVTRAGIGGRYTLTVSSPNSSGDGTIESNVVIFKESIGPLGLNHATGTGTVVGNRMGGLYRQGGTARPCTWNASRRTSRD